MNYVNVFGEPVSIERIASKYKPPPRVSNAPKATTERDMATVSEGFVVAGFSPDHLKSAEFDHKARAEAQASRIARGGSLDRGEKIVGEWSADAYMRQAKPRRVRAKPYEIESAARQCAELAARAGWIGVTVEEILKG